jgi:hypothetical protein
MGGKGSGRKPSAMCGTTSGYRKHKRLKEPPCENCKSAWREYYASLRGHISTGPRRLISRKQYRLNQNAYQRNRRMAQKEIINKWKLAQGECADCGWAITEERLVAIDCDHINPSQKKYSISEQAGSIPFQELHNELAKCQARCRNCHALRTMKEGHWFHKNAIQVPEVSPQMVLFDGLYELEADNGR